MPLYHATIGIPAHVRLPRGQFILCYSKHAEQAARTDRYGSIDQLPAYLDTRTAQVIECEVSGDRVSKILYRIRYSAELDLCLAIIPTARGAWTVKTVWANETGDRHTTLNRAAYAMV